MPKNGAMVRAKDEFLGGDFIFFWLNSFPFISSFHLLPTNLKTFSLSLSSSNLFLNGSNNHQLNRKKEIEIETVKERERMTGVTHEKEWEEKGLSILPPSKRIFYDPFSAH